METDTNINNLEEHGYGVPAPSTRRSTPRRSVVRRAGLAVLGSVMAVALLGGGVALANHDVNTIHACVKDQNGFLTRHECVVWDHLDRNFSGASVNKGVTQCFASYDTVFT